MYIIISGHSQYPDSLLLVVSSTSAVVLGLLIGCLFGVFSTCCILKSQRKPLTTLQSGVARNEYACRNHEEPVYEDMGTLQVNDFEMVEKNVCGNSEAKEKENPNGC